MKEDNCWVLKNRLFRVFLGHPVYAPSNSDHEQHPTPFYKKSSYVAHTGWLYIYAGVTVELDYSEVQSIRLWLNAFESNCAAPCRAEGSSALVDSEPKWTTVVPIRNTPGCETLHTNGTLFRVWVHREVVHCGTGTEHFQRVLECTRRETNLSWQCMSLIMNHYQHVCNQLVELDSQNQINTSAIAPSPYLEKKGY